MTTKTKSGQGGVRYPWDKWLRRKKPFRLTQGEDYQGLSHSMQQQVRNAAYRFGYRVSIQTKQDHLIVTVLGEK